MNLIKQKTKVKGRLLISKVASFHIKNSFLIIDNSFIMPKRGPYFKYLRNEDRLIPASTKSSRKKRKIEIENLQNMSTITSKINFSNVAMNAENNSPQNEFTNVDIYIDHVVNMIYEDDVLIVNESDDDTSEETFMIEGNDTNKTELCAAALAFYFSGRMAQEHFSIAIKFFNLSSSIKLPTSFDYVKNAICSDNDLITFEKKYFCSKCSQEYKLEQRYQPAFVICSSK